MNNQTRDALIKLGKANPELRPHIRPLIATAKTATNIGLFQLESLLATWNMSVAEMVVNSMGHTMSHPPSGGSDTSAYAEFTTAGKPNVRQFIRVDVDTGNPASIRCSLMELDNNNPVVEFKIPLVKAMALTPARLGKVFAAKVGHAI